MQVQRPKLTWLERTYIPQILKGMWITIRHLPQRKFTRMYPEEKPKLLGDYRGAPTLVKDPDNRVKCVSCQLCEFVCPPKAIRITPGFRPEQAFDSNVEKEPKEFVIDMLRCIYCGYCEDACPTEAIVLGDNYELSFTDRAQAIYTKEMLLEAVPDQF